MIRRVVISYKDKDKYKSIAARARHVDGMLELGRAVLGTDVLRPVGHRVHADVLSPREIDPPVPRPAWTRVSQRRVVRVPLLQMGELPNMERAARR